MTDSVDNDRNILLKALGIKYPNITWDVSLSRVHEYRGVNLFVSAMIGLCLRTHSYTFSSEVMGSLRHIEPLRVIFEEISEWIDRELQQIPTSEPIKLVESNPNQLAIEEEYKIDISKLLTPTIQLSVEC